MPKRAVRAGDSQLPDLRHGIYPLPSGTAEHRQWALTPASGHAYVRIFYILGWILRLKWRLAYNLRHTACMNTCCRHFCTPTAYPQRIYFRLHIPPAHTSHQGNQISRNRPWKARQRPLRRNLCPPSRRHDRLDNRHNQFYKTRNERSEYENNSPIFSVKRSEVSTLEKSK